MSKNPFDLKKKKGLQKGRPLGGKNITKKFRNTSIGIEENLFLKIVEEVENSKSRLTLKKIVNDCLKKRYYNK